MNRYICKHARPTHSNTLQYRYKNAMKMYGGDSNATVMHLPMTNETSLVTQKFTRLQYSENPATSNSQLPRIVLCLDTVSVRNTLLVCRDWNRMLDQNNYVWRALSFRVFNCEDPRDLESHTSGWWRKRFLENCTWCSLSLFSFQLLIITHALRAQTQNRYVPGSLLRRELQSCS